MQDILLSVGGPDISSISSQTKGKGEAGRIFLSAPEVTITGGSVTTGTEGVEPGGDIIIEGETVRLMQGAELTAESSGTGNAGNIRIGGAVNTDGYIIDSLSALLMEGSSIVADTNTSGGANITIGAQQVFLDRGSEIRANTNAGVGGNVTMAGSVAADDQALSRAGTIVLRDSQITAKAEAGQGGRIHILTDAFLPILADAFLVDPARVINASSQGAALMAKSISRR